jgi:O-acetyl-ADP-ribose deacetylase (regulator of RNase III)
MIQIITGSLLNATEQYIAHQCNCVSQGAGGIAKVIFAKYPYSNTYANRIEPNKLGTIDVLGNGQDERLVINMYSQYYPGGCWDDMPEDSYEIRQKAFHACLTKIAKLPDLKSIAFPFKIGCGIANGNWEWYLGTLNNFTAYVEKTQGTKVVIYQREEDQ